MKTLKFRERLIESILSGEKTATWRLFDDKELATGDMLTFVNSDTGTPFATAEILAVREKKLNTITDDDYNGNGEPLSRENLLALYKEHYGDRVTDETIIKIVDYKIHSTHHAS